MVNLQIERFKEKIIKDLKESELPIGIKYYILKNIYSLYEVNYYTQLNQELLEEEKKQKEEKTSSTSQD